LYTHELVHVTQKHSLDILFIELLKVIFWFNPIFIFYKKAIQLNHEFLADDEIVKTYNNVPFYQNLLLQKNSNIQTIYLASNLNYLVTKKRLIMMTKSTSEKIATIKKLAIAPILSGLIYFFCIEIVAQEKVDTVKTDTKNSKITDKDKIRDRYYSGVYVNLIDEKNNRKEVILYEDLSLEDRRKYLDFVPEMMIEKEIPEPLFEKMKSKNMAVWINGKVKTKEEIKKYKRTDFSYYTYSFVHKNARSKRFPQEYQYTLYTKQYFDENLKNSHLHYSNDTIKMVFMNQKNKNWGKVQKTLIPKNAVDTLVWYSKDKDGYNIYVNDHKRKKIIVIDAGHGGEDYGAKINDEIESKIVESISKKIKLLNVKDEIEIVLLREDDSYIGLNERLKTINKINPDLLISLHINSSNIAEKNGIQAYVSKDNIYYEESLESANSLIDKISNEKLKKGEVNNANFFIIKNSNCPALTLEIGYLSNNNDREYVTSEKGKNEIANRIYQVIKQF
jgi:N-acetylmuramoyl-L-alanine amidase